MKYPDGGRFIKKNESKAKKTVKKVGKMIMKPTKKMIKLMGFK